MEASGNVPNSKNSGVIRRLAAIVVADVVGYTRLMERDDAGTLARLRDIRAQLIDPKIAAYGGHVVKTAGDGMLVEFGSADAALRCAVDVQRAMAARNEPQPVDVRIEFRIGINLGDIIVEGGDIAGDGVNVAARLEALAEPGGICVSAVVRDQVHGNLDVAFEDISEQQVKNIARSVHVYHVTLGRQDHDASAAPASSSRRRPMRRWWWLAGVAGLGAIGIGVVFIQQLRKPTVPPAPPPLSIAILPFSAPSGSPADVQLADRLAEDLTAALGRSRIARVASRGLVTAYRNKAVDARAVGRELNVRYLVEGEIRAESDGNVLSIRLTDVGGGVQLWSDQNAIGTSAERDEREMLVARSVRRLRVALYEAQRSDPNQSAAMKLVFRAETVDTNSREALRDARRFYGEALRMQPDLMPALIGRGWNSVAELELDPGPDRDRLVQEALADSARAIAIDGDDPVAWNLRGTALGWEGRLDAAFEADARARQLDPSREQSLRAWLLVMNGQANEALAVVDRALSVDPHANGSYLHQKCWASLQLGRYDDAIAACERFLAGDEYWFTHVLLMAAYARSAKRREGGRRKGDRASARAPILDRAVQSPVEIGLAGLPGADRRSHRRRTALGGRAGQVAAPGQSLRIRAIDAAIIAMKKTNVHDGIASPMNSQPCSAHSPLPLSTLPITSVSGIVSSM